MFMGAFRDIGFFSRRLSMSVDKGTNIALAVGLAVVSTVGYALNPPGVRYAFEHGVPVLTSSLFRIFAMLAFAGVLAAITPRGFYVPVQLRKPVFFLGLGTVSVSLGYMSAVAFVPVAIATITFFTFPLIILLLSPLLEGEKVPLIRIALAGLAFVGLAIVVGPVAGDLDWRGLALAGYAALGAATQFLSGRWISGGVGPTTSSFWAHVVCLPIVLAVIAGFGGFASLGALGNQIFSDQVAGISILAVCVSYIFGFRFHMMSLRHAPASMIAPFFYLEPVISIALAVVFLGQHLQPMQYGGCLLVLAALFGSAAVSRRPPGRTPAA
jgi:drug/metabolite transporter (DMT)-like permease